MTSRGAGGAVTGSAPATVAAGLRAAVRAEVTEADTAAALGSGDVPVLGTPRLLALAEAATIAAVAPCLGPGQTTVGTAVRIEHCLPSGIGARLEAEAELTRVDGRRLVFTVRVRDLDAAVGQLVGTGVVDRIIVDRERFLARLPGR